MTTYQRYVVKTVSTIGQKAKAIDELISDEVNKPSHGTLASVSIVPMLHAGPGEYEAVLVFSNLP